MSMRQNVGRSEIEQFLIQVGRTRQPGRLYLSGGASLIHRGIRSGQTLDIDIHVPFETADLTVKIVQLKEKMTVNIEFASPEDFIPLPAQWENRSEFLKSYGQVDVFYFDWYSTVLSKSQRAHQRDIADMQLLVRRGFVELSELDKLYQDVLDKIECIPCDRRFLNLSKKRFALHYLAVRWLLSD